MPLVKRQSTHEYFLSAFLSFFQNLVVVVVVPMVVPVPMAFMQLPAPPLVVVVRVVPSRSFIGRLIPASCNPSVVMPVGLPVAIHPGVTGARSVPSSLIARRSDDKADDVDGE